MSPPAGPPPGCSPPARAGALRPERAPLRLHLYHAGADDHLLSLDLHHSAVDAWSLEILCKTHLFDPAAIDRMIAEFNSVLAAAMADPRQTVG